VGYEGEGQWWSGGVVNWWSTRWQLVYVVSKVGSGAAARQKEILETEAQRARRVKTSRGEGTSDSRFISRVQVSKVGVGRRLQVSRVGTVGALYARQTTRNVKSAMQATVRK
jgi:hypothetical protein